MAQFGKLRGILEQQKPDVVIFREQLKKGGVQKGDLDLLLRKAVEAKLAQFPLFCSVLVGEGANINFSDSKDHVTNLMKACEKGTAPMVEALLSYPGINLLKTDARQLHAGFYAVENKSREDSQNILKQLLQKQPAMVNQQAGNQTLLIAAIRKGKVELVKLLLNAGADPNWQVPDTGNTSLHDAVKQFKLKTSKAMSDIIRFLLLKGGDSNAKNKQQKTVYDYAERALQEYRRIQDKIKQQKEEEQQKVQIVMKLNTEDQVNGLFEEASQLFERYEECQEEEDPFLTEQQVKKSLTAEIHNYQEICQEEYQFAKREIQPFMNHLNKIAATENLGVEFFGSFATGLWVKHSNIDVQLTKKEVYDNFGYSVTAKQILERVCQQLKRCSGNFRVGMFNKTMRVFMIKVDIGDSERPRVIHISVEDRNQTGKAAVKWICGHLTARPQLRPLFLVMKGLTVHYKLHEHKSGGIRSYTLFILLLSRVLEWNNCYDLGKFLLDILYYYGFYYSVYEHRREENDICIAMHIQDPLNPSKDLGTNLRTNDLQRMFRGAYIALLSNVGSYSRLKFMFETKRILMV